MEGGKCLLMQTKKRSKDIEYVNREKKRKALISQKKTFIDRYYWHFSTITENQPNIKTQKHHLQHYREEEKIVLSF